MLFVDKRQGQTVPTHDIIPTPSLGLNKALGGGLFSGATHLFWGSPSVGKTTMCFRIMATAQSMGYRPVIIDSEYSYSEAYASKCGINVDDVVLIQSTVVEDILRHLTPYLNHPDEKHIFLFDSLSNIIKEEFYDKPDGGKAMGLSARSQGYFLQKLVNHLHKEKNLMLFVAHQTVDLSGMYAVLKAKMGNTVHHNMHNIIKLFLSMSSKEMEREDRTNKIVSQRAVWTIEKTKQLPTIGTQGYYYVLPQEGRIDQRRELIDMAVEDGIIERSGAWFKMGDQKWQGAGNIELTDDQYLDIYNEIVGVETVEAG